MIKKPHRRLSQGLVLGGARFVSLGILSAVLSACGGAGAFEKSLDQMWQWDGGVEASRILGAINEKEIPQEVPAAVGVTGRGLVGRVLPDGKLWKYTGAVDVLPTLIGDAVFFTGEGRVTMLDVKTGATRFSVDVSGRRLEGAGYDGDKAVLLLVDSDDAREDQILVLGPNGEGLHSITATARMGTPAAVGGVGLVPYSGQYVGAFDLSTGEHIGRLLLRDGIHTAKTQAGKVLLLGTGATVLEPNVTSSPESQSLKLKPREFPGEPVWPRDGSKPRPVRSSPVGIYAYPQQKEGSFSFAHGAYLATYFEVIVGVDQGSNKLRFATHFPRAVAGGALGASAATLCLENGSIWRVNMRDGSKGPFGSLESRIRACVVNGAGTSVPEGKQVSLLQQIVDTISETGPDMVSMQRLLLTELAESSGSDTTAALLDVAQNPLVSIDLARKAADLLSERKEGGEQMVDALLKSAPVKPAGESSEGEGDGQGETDSKATDEKKSETTSPKEESAEDDTWSESKSESKGSALHPIGPHPISPGAKRRESVRPPPVGALAVALTRLKTPGAVEALAPFLLEPSLSPKDARALMLAIRRLGGAAQVPQVQSFFGTYKNTGGTKALLDALVAAALFLDAHLDEAGRLELRQAAAQSLTHPGLKKRLKKRLKPLAPASAPEQKKK